VKVIFKFTLTNNVDVKAETEYPTQSSCSAEEDLLSFAMMVFG
jgi:hypothetical protein